MSVEALARAYLAEKTPAWTPVSVASTGAKLAHLVAFMAGRSLTRANVYAFVAHVRSRTTARGTPWAIRTVFGVLAAAQVFLKWALLRGHLVEDLASIIVLPRFTRLPRTLSEKEVDRLLGAPQRGRCTLRNRALLELLYGTGLRLAELVRLQLEDLDLAGEAVFVRLGKGRKDRLVPLGGCAAQALLAYLRHERPRRAGPLFLSATGTPITAKAVGSVVAAAAQAASLGKPASPHRLRHSYATHLLENGASLPAIKALLGHSSLASTQVYTAVDVGDLRDMIERCHPRGRARDET